LGKSSLLSFHSRRDVMRPRDAQTAKARIVVCIFDRNYSFFRIALCLRRERDTLDGFFDAPWGRELHGWMGLYDFSPTVGGKLIHPEQLRKRLQPSFVD